MKKILLLLLIGLSINASQQVEVNADSFEADEIKKVSYFRGNVHIKKGSDEINSARLKITFNQKNRPIEYEATGDVTFKIKTEDQHFEGSSKQIIYQPQKKIYKATGDVVMIETTKNRTLKGESITINRVTGKSKISGSKNKPVKFIFTVDE